MADPKAPPQSSMLFACLYIAWLLAAWTGAWALHDAMAATLPFMADPWVDVGFWITLKILVWLAPALALLNAAGVGTVQALGPPLRGLAWGLGVGVVLAAIGCAAHGTWPGPPKATPPWINAVLVAPIVEEAAFRGVVLRAFVARLGFLAGNTLTAAAFVASHAPGWAHQGKLEAMLTAPIGGALSIFVIGWVLGWAAHASRGLTAPILAHALNNHASLG